MWTQTPVFKEDLDALRADTALPWQELEGKRILVTGGTGLIGSTLISALLYSGMGKAQPPRVVALVRSEERARQQFAPQLADCPGCLEFVEGEVQSLPPIDGPVDYIIHGASQTASQAFAETPVDTIATAVFGTRNMLELARQKQVKGFVYLSSMEAYGSVTEDRPLSEGDLGYVDPRSVRSCYPESKRMCENLCCCYVSQYGVPATICRLAQTFGPGIDIKTDARVMSFFLRCALDGRDITLSTPGNSTRMCLYTMDAASALLFILLKGEPGCVYNAANEATYGSVRDTALFVAQEIAGGNIQVHCPDTADAEALKKYPPEYKLRLDCTALRCLGWQPTTDLKAMYVRMMSGMGSPYEKAGE